MTELTILSEQFALYQESFQNCTPTTIKGYRETFRVFLEVSKIEHLEELTKDRVEQWLMEGRMERKWSASTYWTHHKRLSVFFKWLVSKEKLEENFMPFIPKPKREKKLPKGLTKEQADFLLNKVRCIRWKNTFQKERNYTILATMLYTGMRRAETFALHIDHLDFKENTILISQGKGRKDRFIPMCTRLKYILLNYLKLREERGYTCDSLFVALDHDRCIGEY